MAHVADINNKYPDRLESWANDDYHHDKNHCGGDWNTTVKFF